MSQQIAMTNILYAVNFYYSLAMHYFSAGTSSILHHLIVVFALN